MTTLNIDFDAVSEQAFDAAKAVVVDKKAWESLKDIVRNISSSLEADVRLVVGKKESGEFNEDDARVFLDDQKMIARIRIRSVAIIGLQLAERVWNAIAEVFRNAVKSAIGWTIL